MLDVAVIDISVDERLKSIQWLERMLSVEQAPRFTFRPVRISDLAFQRLPDLVILGPSLAREAGSELSHIKTQMPEVPLVLIAPEQALSLSAVEYLGRSGIEDILTPDISATEMTRRLVIIASRVKRHKRDGGQLIFVDAAKGGVGGTTVAAALGELLAEQGKGVLLVDTDNIRQSLSRFLQARPFINEVLTAILRGERPVTPDFVNQSIVQVWADVPSLSCLPPAAPELFEERSHPLMAQHMVNVLEALEQKFDFIIVDGAACRGTLRRVLLRAADSVAFVTDGDPASVFASFEQLRRTREELSPDARIRMLLNHSSFRRGLRPSRVRDELIGMESLKEGEWCMESLPFCHKLSCWPGSGMAPYLSGSLAARRSLRKLLDQLGLSPGMPKKGELSHSPTRSPVSCSQSLLVRLLNFRARKTASNNRGTGAVPRLPWGRRSALREDGASLVTEPETI